MAQRPIGDDPRHWTDVRIGKRVYRVVLSYERQDIGLLRHISMSEHNGKRLPPDDVSSILLWFGFKNNVPDLDRGTNENQMWWWERSAPAFNVVEGIEMSVPFTDRRANIEVAVKDYGGAPPT